MSDFLLEETGASDYIFKRYEEYRDKCDALTRELNTLRGSHSICENDSCDSESGIIELLFFDYKKERDKREELEMKALRNELNRTAENNGTIDFQYKNLIEMVSYTSNVGW